jgi:hypothetical protein
MAAACGHFFCAGRWRSSIAPVPAFIILSLPVRDTPMSFDLYVIHLKDGEPAEANRQSVLDAFDRYGNVERHGDGFYDAFFDDGSHVQFSANGLETDEDFNICAFHLRNFAFPIMRFIYEVPGGAGAGARRRCERVAGVSRSGRCRFAGLSGITELEGYRW